MAPTLTPPSRYLLLPASSHCRVSRVHRASLRSTCASLAGAKKRRQHRQRPAREVQPRGEDTGQQTSHPSTCCGGKFSASQQEGVQALNSAEVRRRKGTPRPHRALGLQVRTMRPSFRRGASLSTSAARCLALAAPRRRRSRPAAARLDSAARAATTMRPPGCTCPASPKRAPSLST